MFDAQQTEWHWVCEHATSVWW